MADAEKSTEKTENGKKGDKSFLLVIVAVVNILVMVGVGAMLFLNHKKEAAEPTIKEVLEAEKNAAEEEKKSTNFIGKLIPLEAFLVNLSGSRGRKLVKVTMELEVNNEEVQEEIDKVKPKIRDMVIMILSSHTYTQVATKEGKDQLRDQIRDQINLFLTRGQIVKVYFTQFIYSN